MNKQLYFSDNGRDWLSEDVLQDELNRVTKVGEHFGAPYCYQGNMLDPEFAGFLVDNKYIGRPVDVEIMKDGSVLLSDDWNGAIYRITHGKAKVAGR